MTSTMMTMGIWGGGISLLCYLAMRRTPNRGPDSRSSGDSFGSVGGPYAGDGLNFSSRSGADSSGFHDSGGSFDSGGGGGDGGGGGGGGGD